MSSPYIECVARAAAILRSLGEDGPAGPTVLGQRLHLHKSTVSRMLATLEHVGLVSFDGRQWTYTGVTTEVPVCPHRERAPRAFPRFVLEGARLHVDALKLAGAKTTPISTATLERLLEAASFVNQHG